MVWKSYSGLNGHPNSCCSDLDLLNNLKGSRQLNNLEVVLENFTYFQLPCEILIEHCVNVKRKAMIYQARLVSTYHKEFTITLLQQKNVISVIHGF